MIPEGMPRDKAVRRLREIAQQARDLLRSKSHDGRDLDELIARMWHKECGVEYIPPPDPRPLPVSLLGDLERTEKKSIKAGAEPTVRRGET
jgi:hypothetical protein